MPKGVYVIDCEGDGLLHEVTKLHVLSYMDDEGKTHSLFDYGEMRSFLLSAKTLICHNLIGFDIPVFEKILGIKIKARAIDTLALSWYLNHTRNVHGLGSYGDEYGVPKPVVDDWKNLTPEQYAHRCEEDVKINARLWKELKQKLLAIYDTREEADRLIDYLMFKMDCLREQEQSKWKFDRSLCEKTIAHITPLLEEKTKQLKEVMPKVVKMKKVTKPSKPYKKDGTLSVAGAKWFNLLKTHSLPKDYNSEVEVEASVEEPNPGSHAQIKDWLFSMGWEPITFKYSKDYDTGEEKSIPQVRIDTDEGKALCPSVLELAETYPAVSVLEGYSVLVHRLSILSKFLEDERDGWLVAEAGGFTNTLRLKHRVLVNLPGVGRDWGKEVRGCLTAPDGHELCGSDMSGLEDNTKRHYMYDYDPEFVETMSDPSFDSHLDLAKFAGAVTEEEVLAYVSGDKEVQKELKGLRHNYKTANYSATYGVGKDKLARTLKVPVGQAQDLLETYWKRNWAILKVVENTYVKTIGREMWLLNPVSGLYYSLRNMKDVFSTLNQSTGVYCFDLWIRKIRAKRDQLTAQFHDEIVLCVKKGSRDKCSKLLLDCIQEVNDELKLNVQLGISIDYGETYAEIH